jgi:hypothetical protein
MSEGLGKRSNANAHDWRRSAALPERPACASTYEEMPEALEFRQSLNIANAMSGDQEDLGADLPDLLEGVTSRANAPEDGDEAPASAAEPLAAAD